MVLGGFEEISNTTLFIPFTSLMMRLEILLSSSSGRYAQSAVIASTEVTARMAMTFS
jgi:hypothetical protein